MSEKWWSGEMVFETATERDRQYERIADWVQATLGTEPHAGPGVAAGLEKQTQGHVGESDGPGFTWSYRIPTELHTDAQVLGGSVMEASLEGALNGSDIT